MSDANYVCRTAFMVLNKKCLENLGVPTDFSQPEDIVTALEDVAGAECDIGGSLAVSAQGLEHIHLAATYPKGKRIKKIAEMWGNAHVEPQRGTKEQAQGYIMKTGKYEEKGENILKVFGDFDKCLTDKSGERTDLSIRDKLIIDRQSKDFSLNRWLIDNIPSEMPSLWEYCKKVHNASLIDEIPAVRPVKVIYVEGESGQGKTYPIMSHMKNVFSVNMDNTTFPWDGYEGEKTVLFDELRPNQVRDPQKLLKWLDRYRCPVNIKNGKSMINADTIFITSAFPFENWYKEGESIKNVESMESLKTQYRRRIDIVYKAENHKWIMQGKPKEEFARIQNGELTPAESKYFKHLHKDDSTTSENTQ